MTAETVGAPRKRAKPFQITAFVGLSIVFLLTVAALTNTALGRTPLPAKFQDIATLTHFALVFAAIPIALVQIALPKGTLRHRITGYVWCGLMLVAAIVSFAMHEITGGFSPPHVFSILTLIMVPLIVYFAHRGQAAWHRNLVLWLIMIMVIAGVLAFRSPGERALATMLGSVWGQD